MVIQSGKFMKIKSLRSKVDAVKKLMPIWSLIYKEEKNGSLSTKYYSMYDCNQMRCKVNKEFKL